MFLAGAFVRLWRRTGGQSDSDEARLESSATATQPGGNMEGKEVRFGIAATALFATITTDASCGAVIGMHDSFTPLGGLVPLFNMHVGEVIFGGTGAGLVRHAAVRHSRGLHRRPDGRTHTGVPGQEDRGKEVKMAMLALIVTSAVILIFHGHQLRDSSSPRIRTGMEATARPRAI